ncbi:hypothetical protein MKZ15_05645 [Paenibacillus sp. FSL R7-0216]|uniref:hypothetical protein n=1 Tax=Paenibacillus sp. FSL R7-0216 TaxID=2921677 RepID=UPI0030DA9760
MNTKRIITLRLLQLILDLTNKATELEGVGIKLVITDELIERVAAVLFEINGIDPAATGPMYLTLADYCSGSIETHDFMSLMSGVAVSSG